MRITSSCSCPWCGRKYAYHRKIERNRIAIKKAKQFHGTRCQACDLSFPQRYGAIGEGFIEAHHQKQASQLPGKQM